MFASKPILLFMDNHRSHEGMSDLRKQVTIIKQPPNCASAHRSMDHDIILAWKPRHKTKLLAVLVGYMDSAQ